MNISKHIVHLQNLNLTLTNEVYLLQLALNAALVWNDRVKKGEKQLIYISRNTCTCALPYDCIVFTCQLLTNEQRLQDRQIPSLGTKTSSEIFLALLLSFYHSKPILIIVVKSLHFEEYLLFNTRRVVKKNDYTFLTGCTCI